MTGPISRSRLPIVLLVVGAAGLLCVAVAAWWFTSHSPEALEAAADEAVEAVHVSATIRERTLVATRAIADFGIGQDVRLVTVRIVDGVTLIIEVTTERDLILAGPPTLCLYGPDPAPDDAGLSDRCWGEPDLTTAVSTHTARIQDGQVILRASEPLRTELSLERGDSRCDYPPGSWTLDVAIEPVIGGSPIGPRSLAVEVDVPWKETGALTLVRGRYCGLASLVYTTQGEPSLVPE